MADQPVYPGVDVQEVSGGARTITGVATSITAFVGRARRGPTDRPRLVQSFAEYARVYGGLWRESPMSYAVQQYFQNGGRDAVICRVQSGGASATLTLPAGFGLVAASEGGWGNRLRARIEDAEPEPGEAADSRFNLLVKDTGRRTVERFLNLSTDPDHPRFVARVLEVSSGLVRVAGAVPAARPTASGAPPSGADPLGDPASSTAFNADGDDGIALTDLDVAGPGLEAGHTGLWLLDQADLFNLLCIPPLARDVDVAQSTWDSAIAYAHQRRALVIVDPPAGWNDPDDALGGVAALVTRSANAALYFPRVVMADALRRNRPGTFAPCGVVAGIYARTDAARGVWKAPAGLDATLSGVSALTVGLSDSDIDRLNPSGINCLRRVPVHGHAVWGARTLLGTDQAASDWKYLPVRRTALFIEESLSRGTQWVVFEPNEEPLWAQIRLSVGSFMQSLFQQGAFQGNSPRDAYFVTCGADTMTQNDIRNGIVNLHVGFAPLRPAEFVVISMQLVAGQVAA